MPKPIVTINFRELEALLKLALSEMRDPEDQLRYMLRQQLIQLGRFLKEETTKPDTSISAQSSRRKV